MAADSASSTGDGAAAFRSIQDYKSYIHQAGGLTLDDMQPNLITTLTVVVASVGKVRRGKSTDYLLPIRVTDPTVGRDTTFPLCIFNQSIEDMPDIRSPGDIVELHGFKTGLLNNDCSIYNKNSSFCTVYHANDIDDTKPLLARLRQWWQAGTDELPNIPNDPPNTNSMAKDFSDPNGLNSDHSLQSPTKSTPAQVIVPQNSKSRFNLKYLKSISDMYGDKFGDLFIEILHIMPLEDESPEFGGRKQRCLVTDYSENPLLPLINDIQFDPPVIGHRVAWCTFHQIDKLNKMPTLKHRRKYWMRNVRAVNSGSGLYLTVSPHKHYPRMVMVIEVEDEHPNLTAFNARRQQMLAKAENTINSNGSAYNATNTNGMNDNLNSFNSPIRSPQPAPNQQSPQTFGFQQNMRPAESQMMSPILSASVMPLADILAGQKLNVKFRVHVRITDIYPKTANESIVSVCKACRMRYYDSTPSCWGCQHPNPTYIDDCQFMAELTDKSTKCMAICPNSQIASKFSGCSMQGLASGVTNAHNSAIERLKELWAWIHFHSEFEWIDLLVAPVIAPGPSANSLVRCLMIVDIAKPLPRVLT
ncbi:hypothetical protein LPJ55_004651 [Coemansia sp. RSA 990]|nr:hypothetical protein LPJ55_004651 [Coemansia sp. RSA 990]